MLCSNSEKVQRQNEGPLLFHLWASSGIGEYRGILCKKGPLIVAGLTTHFVSNWLWCLNFSECVRLWQIGDVFVSQWLTSWQYCSTPSLVPTQLLVPDGSGSQRPVWMLTCMLSFPQNIATCGSATANPVPALAASACRKTNRKREKWGLMPSVITAPFTAGEYCGWQTWDTVCPLAFSHKLRYEPDTGACCEVWTHEADPACALQWITELTRCDEATSEWLSTLGCYCESVRRQIKCTSGMFG